MTAATARRLWGLEAGLFLVAVIAGFQGPLVIPLLAAPTFLLIFVITAGVHSRAVPRPINRQWIAVLLQPIAAAVLLLLPVYYYPATLALWIFSVAVPPVVSAWRWRQLRG